MMSEVEEVETSVSAISESSSSVPPKTMAISSLTSKSILSSWAIPRTVRSLSPAPRRATSPAPPTTTSAVYGNNSNYDSSSATNLSATIAALTDTLSDKDDQISVLRSTLQSSQKTIVQLEEDRDSFRGQVIELKARISAMEGDIRKGKHSSTQSIHDSESNDSIERYASVKGKNSCTQSIHDSESNDSIERYASIELVLDPAVENSENILLEHNNLVGCNGIANANYMKLLQMANARISLLEAEKEELLLKVSSSSNERDKVMIQLEGLSHELEIVTNRAATEETKAREMESVLNDVMKEKNDLNARVHELEDEKEKISPNGTGGIRQTWQHLEETQKLLAATQSDLYEAQSAFASLENKHKALLKQIADDNLLDANAVKEIKQAFEYQIEQLKLESKTKDEKYEELMCALDRELDESQRLSDQLTLLNETIQSFQSQNDLVNLQLSEATNRIAEEKELANKYERQSREALESVDRLNVTINLLNERTLQYEQEVGELKNSINIADNVKENQLTEYSIERNRLYDEIQKLTHLLVDEQHAKEEALSYSELHRNCKDELSAELSSHQMKIKSLETLLQTRNEQLAQMQDTLSLEKARSEDATTLRTRLQDAEERLIEVLRENEDISLLNKELETLRITVQEEQHNSCEMHEKAISSLSDELRNNHELINEHKRRVLQLESALAELTVSLASSENYARDLNSTCESLMNEVTVWKIQAERATSLQEKLDKLTIQIAQLEDENKTLVLEKTNLAVEISAFATDKARNMRQKEISFSKDPNLIDISVLTSIESKHRQDIADLEEEKAIAITELKAKLSDRDRSISAMVQASLAQEQSLIALKEEISTLKSDSQWNHSSKEIQQQSLNGYVKGDVSRNGFANETMTEYAKKIQERDATITALVKASINQEQQIVVLREENDEGRKAIVSSHGGQRSQWALYAKLQHECDIFAGQIIEQDEELEDLRFQLEEVRSVRINLENENFALKNRVKSLEAVRDTASLADEIVTLEEINSELRNDIRDLRKRLRNAQNDMDKVAELEAELADVRRKCAKSNDSIERQLRYDLEHMQSIKQALEMKLQTYKAQETVRNDSENQLKEHLADLNRKNDELQNRIHVLESELEDLRVQGTTHPQDSSVVERLHTEIKEQDDIISALTSELKKLRDTIAAKKDCDPVALENAVRRDMEQDFLSIKSEKEYLTEEVVRLRNEIETLRAKGDKELIEELKTQLTEKEKSRQQNEQSMISTYERKLSLMQMNKDLTIDSLRKDLSKVKAEFKERENDLQCRLKALEDQKSRLEEETATELKYRDNRIKHLEQNLSVHKQVSGHMKEELDQLQSGMESVSVSRRAEIEELQQDLINIQSKVKFYERESANHKMKIEEQKRYYEDEINRLNELLSGAHSDSIRAEVAGDSNHQIIVSEALSRIESLKNQLTSLQDENTKLHEKVDFLNETRSSKNDKWRNSALQEQVFALTQRIREIEGDTGSVGSSSTRRSVKTSKSGIQDTVVSLPPSGSTKISHRSHSAGRERPWKD